MDAVCIVGAGTMGSGIAQAFAQSGYKVFLLDLNIELARKGVQRILDSLDEEVQKGRITRLDLDSISASVHAVHDFESCKEAKLVIEAVPEDLNTKQMVFNKLDSTFPTDVILASNTSSLSIARITESVNAQKRVIGMHFMNPAPVINLVEIIRGEKTSEEVYGQVLEHVNNLGKVSAIVKDRPGFVLNRILIPMINEAICIFEEGTASVEDIDKVMINGANNQIGPLALADLIGLDVCLEIMKALHKAFGDDKYKPCRLLEQMVADGKLGRKSRSGFYSYE
ncbi:3-hydroxybutyryl-CoA dehydrogenase [Candidatus Woesearchaeota archaeon CG11_big_fil_rev_8_21_14_0_20_43_8]|nr:MAG: 3-hydroxybutyryl-CoA dehydrogenase [Candidatus Woesearchaeota archaeon CG11_big_fil_rev_8_21_14_0_20_43_8]PIO05161.1 MAG: 3-hydroxybutyryl-CoA dehydrogenase [Candidatus Woesearchaeota archaeon CG08_land_8_20_14_0_20_43_7]